MKINFDEHFLPTRCIKIMHFCCPWKT